MGNPADTGALEITMGQAAFRVESGKIRLALLGAKAKLTIDSKAAQLGRADLPALAQRRPGEFLRFEAVGLDAARAARRRLVDSPRQLPGILVPVTPLIDSEHLLAANLISEVTDGASS